MVCDPPSLVKIDIKKERDLIETSDNYFFETQGELFFQKKKNYSKNFSIDDPLKGECLDFEFLILCLKLADKTNTKFLVLNEKYFLIY